MDALDELYAATDSLGWARAMETVESDPTFMSNHRAWLAEAVSAHERSAVLVPAE